MKALITIDGPAGSGKSSTAAHLAQKFGWTHINTGAVYRVAALKIIRQSININDIKQILNSLHNIQHTITLDESAKIFMDGKNVTELINVPHVSEAASIIASIPEVRSALLPLQRDLAPKKGICVADGRDTGTIVFPQADLKIFLTATPEARIKRRALELENKGIPFSMSDLEREINERDERDATRSAAPLKPAPDAVIIDTTHYVFDKVIDIIYDLAIQKGILDKGKT